MAVEERTTEYRWDDEQKEEYPVTESDWKALTNASRDLRLRAIEMIDEFLAGFTGHVRAKVRQAGKAEQLAKQR